jgi:hypothetical protein
LMAEQQVLGFKPTTRLKEVRDEHPERMKDRKHRHSRCNDSASSCESAGWNFRKGQGFPSTSKDILHRNPDTHKTGSAKEAINITPKFHFWRQLRLMVAVYEA